MISWGRDPILETEPVAFSIFHGRRFKNRVQPETQETAGLFVALTPRICSHVEGFQDREGKGLGFRFRL